MRSAEHMERGWGNVWNQDMDEYIGHVGKIKGIVLNGLTIEGCATFRFPYFVLEKEKSKFWEAANKLASSKTVKEEGNMEYKTTDKKITLQNILQETEMCNDWRKQLLDDLGYDYEYCDIIYREKALDYAKEHNRLDWLIENGYIVEEKKEITYKIGDWFEAHGAKYWLAQVGNRSVNLIDFESANRKTDPVKVKDIKNITQKEFNKLGDHMESFKKINVEIKEVS